MEAFKKLTNAIEEFTDRPGVVHDVLKYIENKTQIKKKYILYVVLVLTILWLDYGYGAQLVRNMIGYAYPAYYSIKALETGSKGDDTRWLMYWVVFSLFSVVEFFTDFFIGWVPFYWTAKCAFLMWLMSPLDGASTVYKMIIYPYFRKHESTIDELVSKGRKEMSNIADAGIEAVKDYAAEQQLKKD